MTIRTYRWQWYSAAIGLFIGLSMLAACVYAYEQSLLTQTQFEPAALISSALSFVCLIYLLFRWRSAAGAGASPDLDLKPSLLDRIVMVPAAHFRRLVTPSRPRRNHADAMELAQKREISPSVAPVSSSRLRGANMATSKVDAGSLRTAVSTADADLDQVTTSPAGRVALQSAKISMRTAELRMKDRGLGRMKSRAVRMKKMRL